MVGGTTRNCPSDEQARNSPPSRSSTNSGSPWVGVLRINRLDALTQTLDIAASKGLVALPQAKALRPKA